MPDLLPDSCRKNVLGRFCRTLRVFLLQAVLPEKRVLGVLLGVVLGFFWVVFVPSGTFFFRQGSLAPSVTDFCRPPATPPCPPPAATPPCPLPRQLSAPSPCLCAHSPPTRPWRATSLPHFLAPTFFAVSISIVFTSPDPPFTHLPTMFAFP